jgi:hypothetical protein
MMPPAFRVIILLRAFRAYGERSHGSPFPVIGEFRYDAVPRSAVYTRSCPVPFIPASHLKEITEAFITYRNIRRYHSRQSTSSTREDGKSIRNRIHEGKNLDTVNAGEGRAGPDCSEKIFKTVSFCTDLYFTSEILHPARQREFLCLGINKRTKTNALDNSTDDNSPALAHLVSTKLY